MKGIINLIDLIDIMKKILMLTTGGTISSIKSDDGLVPSNLDHVLKYVGIIKDFELSYKELMVLDSSNIQPEEWKKIATAIYKNMKSYDGIVVTHGTDTMAYTTSMISFMIQNPNIPIVFTGSQLPIDSEMTDAINNLRLAFKMALSGTPGIFLAFDREIILGTRAVKVRATSFHAFESVNTYSIGKIDSNGLVIHKSSLPKYSGGTKFNSNINSNVFLLKLTPATNPSIINLLINSNYKGIVIEAFGQGGLQFVRRDFIPYLIEAKKKNVAVVVASQCLYDGANLNIYQVGKKALETGVIESHDMTCEAAVTKLMWVLGQTDNLKEVKKLFNQNLAGEIKSN